MRVPLLFLLGILWGCHLALPAVGYGAVPSTGVVVNAQSYNSLNAAIAAAHGGTLVISGPQKLSGDLLLPADVSLSIEMGGSIINPANYTLTIAGPFSAGLAMVFDGFKQGEVHFLDGSVVEVLPQWWGANSALNINKAINAYSKVFCPAGVYPIESEVLLNSNSVLRGERGKTVFQRPNGVRYTGKNIAGVTYNDSFMVGFYTYGSGNYTARTNVVIEAITVDGNSYNTTDSGRLAGMYLHSGSNIQVIDCEVKNLGRTPDYVLSTGIVFSWIKDGVITGCLSHDNSGDGINAFGFNKNITITKNETYHNGVAGIEVEGRLGTSYVVPRNSGVVISENYSHDNAGAPWGAGGFNYGHGILIDWSDNVVINNNIVSNNAIWIGAITVLGSTNIAIRNNTISNNLLVGATDPGGYAIGIFAQYDVYGDNGVNKNIELSNNVIQNNRNGIFVRDAQDVSIAGNSIAKTDALSEGISCDKGSVGRNLVITNNVVTVTPASTTIAIKGVYDGVAISNNQLSK